MLYNKLKKTESINNININYKNILKIKICFNRDDQKKATKITVCLKVNNVLLSN